jgi:hypothetical protein
MSEEFKQQLEMAAELLLSNTDLAIFLELPLDDIIIALEDDSELGLLIKAARLKTKIAIRDSILTSAKRGSTPAQAAALDMLNEIDRDE